MKFKNKSLQYRELYKIRKINDFLNGQLFVNVLKNIPNVH